LFRFEILNSSKLVIAEDAAGTINEVISQIVENTPGVVPLQKIAPSAIIIYGKLIPVDRK
jgi:polyadenylation factor subunit 2